MEEGGRAGVPVAPKTVISLVVIVIVGVLILVSRGRMELMGQIGEEE